ncbi:MAG: PDZ domain-containing protein, partial [Gammaproteobacteria bacterium]
MNPAKRLQSVFLMLASATLVACGGSSGSGSGTVTAPPDDCSVAAQNETIYEIMQQYYLWYEELPDVDPTSFDSQQALLDALRSLPQDRFSYLTTVAEEEALFGSSQFVGVGFRSRVDAELNEQLVLDVFEGGPADQVGLTRGSRILAVDGVPIADILAAGSFSAALGPSEVGFSFELTFAQPDGTVFTETLVKDVVTIPPVTATRVFDVGGATTGYMVFRNFVTPGVDALDATFDDFQAAGVTQLIVDLRYNGGGLVP